MPENGYVDVIVGLQRGDEGKGRFVDYLADYYDIVARFNGGNNAGHTVVLQSGLVLKLHLVPSGIAHPNVVNVIGNGTLVNPLELRDEIANIESEGIEVTPRNLKLSSGSHLILPHHIYEDKMGEEGAKRQGTTQTGIRQVAGYKSLRVGQRTEQIKNNPDELLELAYGGLVEQRRLRDEVGFEPIDERAIAQEYVQAASQLGKFVTDTTFFLYKQLTKDKPAKVLAEAAQAFLLDIDHGMYPYVTSTTTVSGGAFTGLGIPPTLVNKVTGVAKAVQSHVGDGPFVTEVMDPALNAQLHGDMNTVDAEVGTKTGRTRRLGFLDLIQIRRAQWVNGSRDMILSKLDWVPRYGDTVPICVAYERKGKTLDEWAPDSARKIDQCKPVYEELPTWSENIQEVRRFEDLPSEAQAYIGFIEDQTKVPISMIGVGPEPDQMIIR